MKPILYLGCTAPDRAEAERLLADGSPLVRGAAVWALGKLLSAEKFAALKRNDDDASVNEEWAALN